MINISVIKKDNTECSWASNKITTAIKKSADRISLKLSDEDISKLIELVEKEALVLANNGKIKVSDIHEVVISKLMEINPLISESYSQYRQLKKRQARSFEKVLHESDRVLQNGDRENANFDSTLTSTKSSLIRGVFTSELYRSHILGKEYLKEIEDGFIYIHDLRDLIFNSINCCLFDMGNVLKGGFEMSNQHYTEPKDVLVALQVIGDVMLTTTAQQFGGFTIPDIDKILLMYVQKARIRLRESMSAYKSMSDEDLDAFVEESIKTQLRQGFQSIEMKMNTIPSGRGDFAFTTLTFGNVDSGTEQERRDQKLICDAILDVRMNGTGENHQPVTFPKLVFLFNRASYDSSEEYKDLFHHGIKCTSMCMYPDFLSVDAEGSYVGDMYSESGEVDSPMGCRAYLSKYTNPQTGKLVFTGRANIGAVSLNLPMIYYKSKGEKFYEDLDHYLEMIRKFHIMRYDAIANNYCSSNPMAFTQGGLLGGNKQPNEKIGHDIVKTFTASFGVTAFNELNILHEGKPLHESDGKFVNEVLDHINKRINEFKEADGYLYALYGTPAESLCGKQLQQFRKYFGDVAGVTDREYFTNSFHAHVTAQITPFEKQDIEYQYFHKCLGGHIQYVRLTTNSNLDAIAAVVLRGMKMGFYQGINFDLVFCESCGFRPDHDVEHCPKCGSSKIMIISRVCGYIGFLKSGGVTRFNDAKVAEVLDRVSM
ncbi:anaerobic ribonucleoside-triphosphate reductase [Photobacterium damselae]|uniref:anaerobic ribonucleoside-triphosphate reductase n=1 Tax=Photobacterium damselae TaxID=38293 RepID=UPI001EEDD00E|nr:anaerobic ribonucleoside-triphosphate reductase [Photobacterium damselae]UKA04527.1 anaerobic ribonucleoside-triphosphate reductase [Photobacterium damselae subsp. damselae]